MQGNRKPTVSESLVYRSDAERQHMHRARRHAHACDIGAQAFQQFGTMQ